MVFLAITPEGLQRALQLASDANLPIWCGSDAVSDAEYSKLAGRNVSRFVYPLHGASAEVLQGAVDTIAEHHPGEQVWVEHAPRPSH
ncbi:hypothetical protein ACS15_3485 [Ralstonia insidiosa]|uniref:Uncharacterized protein n=1 Tax=Ralstonia insidiosa TaxID=190721 RepID=A0AAC9FQX2_9RALS|nr:MULTISPECIES: hypothetical protein [Ralstonia]ANH73067.1 hypothetical protein ACS15_3485 [Ralstonia insidiosa]MBY4707533.1 hypothetical protein [Ralstonia insidiosa]GAQ28356.1 hypothetical protein SAMD00023378_2039 [Ralstonia sp. NT80]